jgi:hypothetical protein
MRKKFFFVKKNQKTFGPCRRLAGKIRDSGHGSFLLWFFEEERDAANCKHGSGSRTWVLGEADPGFQ